MAVRGKALPRWGCREARRRTASHNEGVSIGLGMPSAPPPVVAPRRKSRQILLRHDTHPVYVGGDAPVSVQSMTTTDRKSVV